MTKRIGPIVVAMLMVNSVAASAAEATMATVAERFDYGRPLAPVSPWGDAPHGASVLVNDPPDSSVTDGTALERRQMKESKALVTGGEARKRLIVFGAVVAATFVGYIALHAWNQGAWF